MSNAHPSHNSRSAFISSLQPVAGSLCVRPALAVRDIVHRTMPPPHTLPNAPVAPSPCPSALSRLPTPAGPSITARPAPSLLAPQQLNPIRTPQRLNPGARVDHRTRYRPAHTRRDRNQRAHPPAIPGGTLVLPCSSCESFSIAKGRGMTSER
jgi:hypothetical protein